VAGVVALTWPDDVATAVGILIFVMIVVWWRNRLPIKYDITLHHDETKDKKTPPGPRDEPDGD
jgi:hypothetical protein